MKKFLMTVIIAVTIAAAAVAVPAPSVDHSLDSWVDFDLPVNSPIGTQIVTTVLSTGQLYFQVPSGWVIKQIVSSTRAPTRSTPDFVGCYVTVVLEKAY